MLLVRPPDPRNLLRLLAWLCLAGLPARAAESAVRMLVPGFTVEEVPVRLPNVNNLAFATDGSLTVLGYNGRVWRLSDTDDDGLEDRADAWWDRDTLTVPVGMHWTADGLLVSSSGKVSRLRDTDGDGRADREEVIAQGWPGKDEASGNVDATGVTVGPDGALYFALLTANYANPYRVKKVADLTDADRSWLGSAGRTVPADPAAEVSLYDPAGERGTIQRLDPATGRRETWATGLRVVYQLRFNAAGDLFCTDQEGETWCPGGNPLDELNHVVKGRNYGFPPAHPRWAPDLMGEPPVAAFGPQHQSACGFVFNEPCDARPGAPAQGLFGPETWRGDALVTGESRGKLWRVRLRKSTHGYTGEAFTFARLGMLVTDVAVSPRGDLYLSCHSGLPDWGTGPNGEGRLFRIRYTAPAAPQPVSASAAGATEVRVTFDRALDAAVPGRLAGAEIEFGEHVRAGDPFETLKPPYETVQRQEAAPRFRAKVRSARLAADGRELILTTTPHAGPGHGRVVLPLTWPGGQGTAEVDYALASGVFPAPAADAAAKAAPPPEVVGDFENGRELFTQRQCITCHRLRGEGTGHGPDLDNLASRDVSSVLRDLREPSAAINPDFVGYHLVLADGTEFTGFVRPEGNDRLKLITATGVETLVRAEDVKQRRPTGESLMPAGLLDGLTDAQVAELLTFLRHAPPKRDAVGASRLLDATRSAGSQPGEAASGTATRPVKLVLVASKQDHGPGQHDYPRWQTNWARLLGGTGHVEVEKAWEWPSATQFAAVDAAVFYFWNHEWNAVRYAELDAFQRRGGGVVVLHSATIADLEPEQLAERLGLAAQPGRTGYRHMPFTLRLAAGHPLAAGLPVEAEFLDEPYWPLIGDPARVQVLATAEVDGVSRPLVWTYQRGAGRVFASIPGHYSWTLDDPLFRVLILRGIAWAAQAPAGALEPLALKD
ncbi:MAG: ThuA domain-containing protein [Limisphaerales bacterium]